MDTLKTAVVVVLLLAVLYGVYVVLNRDEPKPPPEFAWAANETLETEGGPGFTISAPPGAETISPPDAGPGVAPRQEAGIASPSAAPTQPPYATEGGLEPTGDSGTESGAAVIPPPPPGFPTGSAGEPSSPAVDLNEPLPSNLEPPTIPPNLSDDQSAPRFGGPSQAAPEGASRYGDPPAQDASAGFPNQSRYAEPGAPSGAPTGNGPAGSGIGENSISTPGAPPTEGPSRYRDLGKSSASIPTKSVAEAKAEAETQIKQGDYYKALYTLSAVFGDPTLDAKGQRELLDLLDPLAGRVIYSPQHLLAPEYRIQRGDDLMKIAAEHKVPHQLLQNINGVKNPNILTPGDSLKVVKGPFRAEVDLNRQELILFLGQLYAGRFPITLGNDPPPRPGEYTVKGKERGRAYYGRDGVSLQPNHPQNPFGGHWLDLGSEMSLHGSASSGENRGLGCISLSPIDASDVFGILSQGSKVLIRR